MTNQDPPQSGNPSGGDDTWSTYTPPGSKPTPETPQAPPPPSSIGPTHVPYGSKQDYTGTYPPAPGTGSVSVSSDLLKSTTKVGKTGCGIAGIFGVVIFIPVVIGLIFAFRALSGGFDDLDDGIGNPFDGDDPPDLTTAAAFDDLVAALREETGSTTVFDASLYGEYAVVWVPADKTSKRYYSYYYDGEFRKTSQGSTDYARFDLSTIDGNLLPELFEKAEKMIEDPTSTYVLIRAPQEHDNGAWFAVYASNDFQESGYFTADKTGKVVMEYPPTP